MSSTDTLVKNLVKTLMDSNNSPSPYDTTAEVRRIDGDTAWVHIPGGVDETPVQLTTNAKKGDMVQVRVSGGRAWLYGNVTSPPTDDTKAIQAEKKAVVADEHAADAMDSASIAKQAADSAVEDAAEAAGAASRAEEAAGRAETAAVDAQEDAMSAYNSATQAISQLSVVEDIVGVLDLIATNGTYTITTDIEAQQDKWYFLYNTTESSYAVVPTPIPYDYFKTQDSSVVEGKTYYTLTGTAVTPIGNENPNEQDWYVLSSGNYVPTNDLNVVAGTTYYTITATEVSTPVDANIGTYYEYLNSPVLHQYYELSSIDESIQNYVASHLVLAGNSLFLQNGDTRVELSTTTGMTLYNEDGTIVANYGKDTTIGNISGGFGIKIGESPDSHYELTEDSTIIVGKTYYTRSGTDPNYVYTPVANPDVSQIGTYYEYVLIYELGFYQEGNRVAYINNNSLYITQTVVLKQMQMGDSLGVWAWCIHQVGAQNNLYLKWLG